VHGSTAYVVVPVQGLARSEMRGLAYLACADDDEIDADSTIAELQIPKNLDRRRQVWSRFDYWVAGGRNDNYFHGWPNEESYKHCFVFKWKDNRLRHRLYGFLCNPLTTKPRFQLCVLVSHRTKSQHLTDPREKARAEGLRVDAAVKAAVAAVYPKQTEVRSWLN
jgi:hypothetical protein